MTAAYLYVHDLRASGVVRNALALAARLAETRPTTLVAGCGGGFFLEAARAGAAPLVSLAEQPVGRIGAAWRLRRWLAAQPPGVLLSMGNLGHSSVWLASRGDRRHPRIYRISNEVSRDDGARNWLRTLRLRLLLDDATQVAAAGATLAQAPAIARRIAAGRAVAIANGVDRAHAAAGAAAAAPHPWLEKPVPVVLGIGRLSPQKDFDLLIEGVARARATRRLRLAVIGEGSAAERARLTALADARGLGADFLLAGSSDNVFAWLARAAVFCLSSRYEGSSMALLEALAVNTPIVAAREAGDAAQVLGDGRYGLLFDGRDPAALAAALLRQAGPEAVLPGDRADAYGPSLDSYVALVDRVQGRAGTQR